MPDPQLIRELRDLRKGRGLTPARVATAKQLLETIGVSDVQRAYDALVDELNALGTDIRPRALLNAYGLGDHRADLLTTRRNDFAVAEQRHTDTIEKYENEMIDELAHLLEYPVIARRQTALVYNNNVRFDLIVVDGFLREIHNTDSTGKLYFDMAEDSVGGTSATVTVVGDYESGRVAGDELVNVRYFIVAYGKALTRIEVKVYENMLAHSVNRPRETIVTDCGADYPMLSFIDAVQLGSVISFSWTLEE